MGFVWKLVSRKIELAASVLTPQPNILGINQSDPAPNQDDVTFPFLRPAGMVLVVVDSINPKTKCI